MATTKRWGNDDNLGVYLEEEVALAFRITDGLLDDYNITGDEIPDHILDTAGDIEHEEAQNLFPGGVPMSVPEEILDQLARVIAGRLATRIQQARADRRTRYAVWGETGEPSNTRQLTVGLTCREALSFRGKRRARGDVAELYVYPVGRAPWELSVDIDAA
jgi:hypothetical protein